MRRGRGFTIIELLIVLVVMGVLVAVLVPRWEFARSKAMVVTMKSDLHNLAMAEEAYFFDHATYTTSVPMLIAFSSSRGVTITVNETTSGGWSATASHSGTPRQCFLYTGNVTPVGVAPVEGQVTCS